MPWVYPCCYNSGNYDSVRLLSLISSITWEWLFFICSFALDWLDSFSIIYKWETIFSMNLITKSVSIVCCYRPPKPCLNIWPSLKHFELALLMRWTNFVQDVNTSSLKHCGKICSIFDVMWVYLNLLRISFSAFKLSISWWFCWFVISSCYMCSKSLYFSP